jgi:cell division protein FtsZ
LEELSGKDYGNYVTNGDFETGTEGWNMNYSGNVAVSLDRHNPLNGQASLYGKVGNASSLIRSMAGWKVYLFKGRQYRLEFDARGSEGSVLSVFFDTQTAGMGGGTGTGAAPVIAGIAREMDILTVGIVTIPFRWEGESKINQALDGVEEMSKNVDALLVINNEQLFRIYPDLTVKNAFLKADDTLTIAAKSIAEIITVPGYINLDFADVNTILKDGGVAVMSAGYGKGQNRLTEALNSALKSPLLNNNDVFRARKILFNITCSDKSEIMTHEMEQIRIFMDQFVNQVEEVIWGIAADNDLDDQIKVTMLASGFGIDDVPQVKVHRQIKNQELEEDIEEKRRKRENRKSTYYPDDFGIPPRRLIYKPRVLSNQEMDNEELIDQLDQQPANQRPFA